MALQANIPLKGGITHNNGYVRVTNARVCRKDNADWFLMVDVAVYKDADERAKGEKAETIICPPIDKFKFAYSVGDESGSNLIAHSYAKLKTESIFDGASDV